MIYVSCNVFSVTYVRRFLCVSLLVFILALLFIFCAEIYYSAHTHSAVLYPPAL